jgi:hypothetical protein
LEKFKLAANNSVALSTIGEALIASAYDQATNRPSGYHQGFEGYGKRFGADMARAASDNLFGTFLLASALHQDPRFFVKKNLSFGQSVKYAAVRVIYTSTDSGEKQVNYSGLIGPLMAEGLANAYYPDKNRTAGSTLTRYGSDLGWRFGGNLLRQYWPAINRRLRLAPENPGFRASVYPGKSQCSRWSCSAYSEGNSQNDGILVASRRSQGHHVQHRSGWASHSGL